MPSEIPPKVICAVPKYLEKCLKSAKGLPPGHIFNLYAPMWVSENFRSEHGGKAESKWEIAENIDEKTRWNNEIRKKEITRAARDSGKTEILSQTAQSFPKETKEFQERLIKRQIGLAEAAGAFVMPCKLNAPLATGLGNEHPVENGFSFLSPYGLPYIAGSSVKGALRRAAEIMALFGEEYGVEDFCMLDVWFLFGFEGVGASYWACSKKRDEKTEDDKRYIEAMAKQLAKLAARKDLPKFLEMVDLNSANVESLLKDLTDGKRTVLDAISFRGVLTFWDAFPACDKMAVEIMTPHYGHYYQKGKSPHDSGKPNPIPFLVVPVGSEMNLVIQCQENRAPNKNWRELCERIIEFAAKWQGFGSKSAIGYGDFSIDTKKVKQLHEEAAKRQEILQENARLTRLSAGMRKIEEFKRLVDSETKTPYKPGQGRLDQKFKPFFADCDTLTAENEVKAALEALEQVFAYVKANDKKKKEVRAEIEKLNLRLHSSI